MSVPINTRKKDEIIRRSSFLASEVRKPVLLSICQWQTSKSQFIRFALQHCITHQTLGCWWFLLGSHTVGEEQVVITAKPLTHGRLQSHVVQMWSEGMRPLWAPNLTLVPVLTCSPSTHQSFHLKSLSHVGLVVQGCPHRSLLHPAVPESANKQVQRDCIGWAEEEMDWGGNGLRGWWTEMCWGRNGLRRTEEMMDWVADGLMSWTDEEMAYGGDGLMR